MADRKLYQDDASFHPGEVAINLEFTAGTSGAVPSTLTRRAGITSVVLTATGIYTVVFQDTWYAALAYSANILQATYDVTHATNIVVKPAEFTTSGIVLRCYTGNGVATAAALTSGDVIKARFTMAKQQGNG